MANFKITDIVVSVSQAGTTGQSGATTDAHTVTIKNNSEVYVRSAFVTGHWVKLSAGNGSTFKQPIFVHMMNISEAYSRASTICAPTGYKPTLDELEVYLTSGERYRRSLRPTAPTGLYVPG